MNEEVIDADANLPQPSTSIQMFASDIIPERTFPATTKSYTVSVKNLSEADKRKFFEIDECVQWIKSNGYCRVALQFPDSLLPISSCVASWLENETAAKVFILADTSYRSCCIDDIAAEHANVDCLIHYGDACLTEYSGRYPLRYVFGSLQVDLGEFKKVIEKTVTKFSKKCLLLYDVVYSKFSKDLETVLLTQISELINASVLTSRNSEVLSLGRFIPKDFDSCSDVTVIFVGKKDSPLLTLWLMTHVNCTNVLTYFPSLNEFYFNSSQGLRQLRKRLFLIEKMKDANSVGLVVCSLGVSGHQQTVQRLRRLCKTAMKKCYVFSVGKINVAKLSNFANDIDVFVVISCPYGVVLDLSDYYRPIVSVFEAEIAFNSSKEWEGMHGWTADSKSFIDDEIGEADRKPDVSLITGRIRGGHKEDDSKSNSCTEISLYSAGDYVGERSWKGLSDACTDEESTELREGRKGVASHYVSENI